VAEHERLRHADAFRRAEASGVERGIHLASRLPTGFTRDPETRRLVPNEMAPVVAEVFRLRAKGRRSGRANGATLSLQACKDLCDPLCRAMPKHLDTGILQLKESI
jgi:hypothetical protein